MSSMTEQQVEPRSRRGSRGIVVVSAAVAVLAVAALAYVLISRPGSNNQPPAPAATAPIASVPTVAQAPAFTMTGSFDIIVESSPLKDGQECQGTGPSGERIGLETPVRVFDQDGQQIALGGLGQGATVKVLGSTVCKFSITVDNVPDGLPSYGVEIASYGVQQVTSNQAHSNVFLSEGP